MNSALKCNYQNVELSYDDKRQYIRNDSYDSFYHLDELLNNFRETSFSSFVIRIKDNIRNSTFSFQFYPQKLYGNKDILFS